MRSCLFIIISLCLPYKMLCLDICFYVPVFFNATLMYCIECVHVDQWVAFHRSVTIQQYILDLWIHSLFLYSCCCFVPCLKLQAWAIYFRHNNVTYKHFSVWFSLFAITELHFSYHKYYIVNKYSWVFELIIYLKKFKELTTFVFTTTHVPICMGKKQC